MSQGVSVQSVEVPHINTDTQILIEVRAASLDPVDLKVRESCGQLIISETITLQMQEQNGGNITDGMIMNEHTNKLSDNINWLAAHRS